MMALLKLAGIPKATYYYYVQKNQKTDKYKELKELMRSIFYEHNARYGYRRITLELRNRGVVVNHKLVLKLMNEMLLRCKVRRKKYKSYKGEVGKSAPHVIKRDFKAEKPRQKWTTDVSEFSISAGKLYLSPILDMFNGEIISYHVGRSPNFQQTMLMLDSAFSQFEDLSGLILHSDQGWQYRQVEYQHHLEKRRITQSMSRKGNCLDNTIMENFFGIMKSEMFYGHEKEFQTLEELELAIKEYIEYYNNRRIKLRLKGMSPVQYREHFEKSIA